MMGEASAAYHPGQSGTLRLGPKKILAEYGVLHPKMVKQFDLSGSVVAAALFLDAIPLKLKTGFLRPSSDERRAGTECLRTWTSWWSLCHYKQRSQISTA